MTLPPSFCSSLFLIPNGTGEQPILLKTDVLADRVPDTPANTYISIAGKKKDVFNE